MADVENYEAVYAGIRAAITKELDALKAAVRA
jgi:hypothetical protein